MPDIFDAFGDEDDAPRPVKEKKARRKKNSRRGAAVIVVFIAMVAGVGFTMFPQIKEWFGENSPFSNLFENKGPDDYAEGEAGDPTEVTIPAGSTGADMAAVLAENDIVASPQAFIDAFNADAESSAIQPGTYTLPTKIPASRAVDLLKDHDNQRIDLAITIPEGFTKQQVYERIANVMDIPLDEVVAAAEDAAAIGLPEVAGGDPEGWFQPGQERFRPGTDATEILSTFISNRVATLDELEVPEDKRQEVLIKASILEREVNQDAYFPQVAAVIDNRLEESSEVNKRLQMDSTVLYGVGKTGGIPTRADLDDDNPYNTYLHPGLPPTPIGSAGTQAISGVLNPADGDWLYFVTVDLQTGETLFAATLEEHNENVAKLSQWLEDHPDFGREDAPAAEEVDG